MQTNQPPFDLVGFDPATVGGLFDYRNFTVSVTTNNFKLINSNPNRVLIHINFANFAPVFNSVIGWGGTGPSRLWVPLPTTTGLTYKYADYGPIVGMDWYMDNGIGNVIGIWELCYYGNTKKAYRQNPNGAANNKRTAWRIDSRRGGGKG